MVVKEIFSSTKIVLEVDGTYSVDNPIDYVTGFSSFEDAYKYCIKLS